MTTTRVDTRERDLILAFQTHAPLHKITVESLHVGDVVVGDIVLERKTLADLAASIKDGRYAEQKQRLSRETRVIVVIEGRMSYDDGLDKKTQGIANKGLVSAVLNSALRDGFVVMRTDSLIETLHLIVSISTRMDKYEAFSNVFSAELANQEYQPNVIKSVKRENLTPDVAFLTQLCTVPQVSMKTAERLKESLPGVASMSTLIKRLERCADLGVDSMTESVGAAVASNIIEYLGVSMTYASDVRRYFPRRIRDGSDVHQGQPDGAAEAQPEGGVVR
jgi:ERCC4-type nuclease